MAEFIDYPIKTDPDDLLSDFIAELRTFWPNWEPNEGSLLYRAAAALCRIIATGTDVAALVPSELFRTVGGSLFKILPNDGTQSAADTTWMMIDNAGYTIPAGTVVSIEGVLFETISDAVVPNGTAVITPVAIRSIDDGAATANLGTAGGEVRLEEGLAFVLSVTQVGPSAGGGDPETQDEYTVRLVEALSLLTIIPVLAPDLPKVARTVSGVFRATVLDNYDASTSTAGVPGHATVGLQDDAGGIVPSGVKDDVTTLLTAANRRLINAVIHVVDADYTPVDVTVNGIVYPNADIPTVEANVQAAIAAFLDSTAWGRSQDGTETSWINQPVVGLYDLAAAIDQAQGFDRITGLQVGLNGGVQVAADQNLPGVIPLPTVGAIVVNLVTP